MLNSCLSLFIFLLFGIYVISGKTTLGQLIGYNFYLGLVMNAFITLCNFQLNFQTAVNSIEKIETLMKMPDEVGGEQILRNITSIKYKKLCFCYPGENK